MSEDFPTLATRAIGEIDGALGRVAPAAAGRLCDEIAGAGRIGVYGLGRELLMLRAFAMRLMHLGLDAQVVGDVTAGPLGPGDLLIVSAGPGELATAQTMVELGQKAGARVLVVTAQPQGSVPRAADAVIHLPAQTMADDRGPSTAVLPMGSLYEVALLVFFDLVAVLLRDRTGQTNETMRARHQNLE